MWTYEQSGGRLLHDAQLVATGYAGGNIPPNFDATAKNNPAREREHYFGPLPQGLYTIGPAHTEPQLGPVAMRLTPDHATVMYGRAGFFIHADSVSHPGKASEGCIVMPGSARAVLAASNDRQLTVVAGK
jgi:type VI secretion system (T6SS) effector TldE1-like protein